MQAPGSGAPGPYAAPIADLQLPAPPDAVAGAIPRRSGPGLVIGLVVVLCIMGVLGCGGVVALVSNAITQMQEPAVREAIDPWLSALQREDYETAARNVGPGVTANQVRDEVERHIGAPLQSWERDKNAVGLGSGRDSPGSVAIRYRLQGSRGSATVDISVPMTGSYAPGKPSRVTVPAWGLVPSPERPRRTTRAGPERAPGPESAPPGGDALSLGGDTIPPPGTRQ